MISFYGRVDSVFTRQLSASIAAPADAGATTLTVVDGDDLDPIGQIQTPWDDAVYSYTYDDLATVTLTTPLATAADDGEILLVWDPAKAAPVVDSVAHVAVLGDDNADDIVEARVSFALVPMLAEGIRDEDTAEAVAVRVDGTDYVVSEILGQAAALTDDFADHVAEKVITTDHLIANNALINALQAQVITGVEIEGGIFRTDAGDRRIEIGPVSTESGGGRIDFYSPDLDRSATIIASTQGTLGITSGGDLDAFGEAQNAALNLTGVGPFSTLTGAALEASAINLNTSGSYAVAPGTIALDADAEVSISAPSIIIGGQTFGDTGWIDIALASGYEAAETGVPQYRVKNGYVSIRGSIQQTATGTLALNSSPGHTIGTLPVEARPIGGDIVTLTPPQNPANNQARLFVWTNGTLKVYLTGAGAAAYVALGVVYPI